MDVALWITIAVIVVTSIIFAYIFRSASGKAINNGTYPVDIMYNNLTIFDSINYHEIYCNKCLGKTSDTRSAEGTDGEDVADRQAGAAGQQDARRRGGLRAQLQASRRARLARISEDEQDGMSTRTWPYKCTIHSFVAQAKSQKPISTFFSLVHIVIAVHDWQVKV